MLFLNRGAVLRGSSDLNEYPELRTHRKGLIHAENVHNTGICGSGVIDANGNDTVFMEVPNPQTVFMPLILKDVHK